MLTDTEARDLVRDANQRGSLRAACISRGLDYKPVHAWLRGWLAANGQEIVRGRTRIRKRKVA